MRHKQVAGTHLQAARGRPIRYKLPDSRRAEFRQEAQTSFPSSYGRYVSLLLFKPEAPMTENSLKEPLSAEAGCALKSKKCDA